MDLSKEFTLKIVKKSQFDCHFMFLFINHPFKRNKNVFIKNKVEKFKASNKIKWGSIVTNY